MSPRKTRRGAGEGSVYKRSSDGLWAASIELPPAPDGRRRRKVISGKDKGKVIRSLSELRRTLETRGDIPTAGETVGHWFEYWLREVAVKTRRPKTVASYRSIIDTWVIPTIGKVRLDKTSPSTVRRVFTAMEDAGKSSTYMRNAHSIMSAGFKDAEREGRIQRSPVELVIAPRRAVTDLQALTPDEAINLLRTFSGHDDSVLWATFLLTGARRGEVLGLEWGRVTDTLDLSWQLQRITDGQTIPAGFEYRHITNGLYLTRPKTRAGWRIVPLVDPLASILAGYRDRAHHNPYGLVFAMPNGRPFDPDFITKQWPEILASAGVDKKVRVHDLRHTTIDLLFAAGVDPDDITAIVGHSSRAMSQSYRSKANLDRLRESMLQLSASLT